MVTSVSVQYNSGFLPDIMLSIQCYLPSGNPIKCHEEVLSLQSMIPPKRFDIPPPLNRGCSEGLGAFRFSFKRKKEIQETPPDPDEETH